MNADVCCGEWQVYLEEMGTGEGPKEVWSGPMTSCKVKASPEHAYEVTVVAYNAKGPGTSSIPVTVTTPPAPAKPVNAPRPPPKLAPPLVSVRGAHSAVATWGGGGKGVRHVMEIRQEDEGEWAVVYEGVATSHEFKNMEPQVTNHVRVRVVGEHGMRP